MFCETIRIKIQKDKMLAYREWVKKSWKKLITKQEGFVAGLCLKKSDDQILIIKIWDNKEANDAWMVDSEHGKISEEVLPLYLVDSEKIGYEVIDIVLNNLEKDRKLSK